MNESISTAGWEFSVLEVLRGEPAMDELQGASAFNKPPEDAAMEYVLVRLRVKYVGASSEPKHVDRGFFESAGSDGTRYERPSILDVDTPAPVLQGDLTTGGSAEVWITLLALKDDPGLVLVIEPRDNGISMVAEHTRYVLIGS